ncbi:MAG: hypothetical protein N3I35_19705, partial [Clostridia bacterium]|nr:hypothetical protein [Clostridia bacterium]
MLRKLCLSLFAMFLSVFALNTSFVFADSVTDNYNNYVYPISVYKQGSVESFSIRNSAQSEYIDPASGNLDISQTDLVLKGRNGLDLAITRNYSLYDANYCELQCYVSSSKYTVYSLGFGVNGTQTVYKYINGVLSSTTPSTFVSQAPYYSYSQPAQLLADRYNNGEFDTSYSYMSGNDTIMEVYKYSDFKAEIRYYFFPDGMPWIIYDTPYWDELKNDTVNENYFNLGTGWSLDFPFIEERGDYEYLHYGSYGTWLISFDSDGGDSHLVGYPFKDRIVTCDGTYNNGEMNSSYVLTEKDGKKTYFGSDGRLLGIKDRFGNEIKFYHDTSINYHPLISKIIDSVGRTVNITYSSSRVTIEVVDDTEPANNKKIYYNRAAGGPFGSDYNLTSVVDPAGRETKYEYTSNPTRFCYRKKDPVYAEATNYYACLKSITYPTGGKTEYKYSDPRYTTRNLGVLGNEQFLKVTERADYKKDGSRHSYKKYIYNNYFIGDGKIEYDGYPNYFNTSIPGSHVVTTDIDDVLGNRQTYTYKYLQNPSKSEVSMFCTGILSTGADHKIEVINTYDPQLKLKTATVNRVYNKSTGKYIEKVENYQYDSVFRDLLGYWDAQASRDANNIPIDDEHKTSYTYDIQYHYPITKTYKKDGATTITEEYTPYADHKAIEWARIKENGTLRKQAQYLYDSYGNVSEERNYLDNWTDFVAVKYSYDDNVGMRNEKFNGAYLTRKWVENVRDADGNLIASKTGYNPGVIDETVTYDWYGNITAKSDGQGNVIQFSYDKLGRPLTQINPDNSCKAWEYNDSENYVIETNENNSHMKTKSDEFGNKLFIQDMTSGEILSSFIYDELSRLKAESNNNNKSRTVNTYCSDGRLVSKEIRDDSDAVKYKEVYAYDDAFDNGLYSKVSKTVIGDASSPSITTNSYANKLGLIEKQSRMHEGIEYFDTFKYDYMGNKTEEKSARAYNESWTEPYTAKYEYNFEGKPTKAYNIKGDFTTTEYDALGRAKAVTDIKGNKAQVPYSASYEYDSMGRVLKESIPFESNNGILYYSTKKHYYDRNGNIVLEKVSSNKAGETDKFDKTAYEYNSRNMLLKVTLYNGEVPENYTQYYYDAVGNKVRMYTGLSSSLEIMGLDNIVTAGDEDYSVTKYEYNQFGQLRKMVDPLLKEESYEYDYNGNLIQKTDRNGNVITYIPDSLNRTTSMSVITPEHDGDAVRTYSYSLAGSRIATGADSNTLCTYDDLGRLISETGSDGVVKEYTYDAANNRKSMIIKKNGQTEMNTTYTYDKMNRLHEVFENGQLTATYAYDDNGNRESLVYSNGNSTEYSYNLANKVILLTNKKGTDIISQYSYTYSLDGNQTGKNETITGKSTDYIYDGAGRLATETEKLNGIVITSTGYSYDDYNNREQMTVTGENASTTIYEYDKANRLLTEVQEKVGISEITRYNYDDNGNQIYKAVETEKPIAEGEIEDYTAVVAGEGGNTDITISTYNGFNQLTGTTIGDKTVEYGYNGDGLRTSKAVNGAAITHVWDGDQIVLELDGAGNVANKYVRGINLVYSEDGTGNNRKYMLFNAHGDVVQLTGTDGNVIKSYDYDAFGNEKNLDQNDT